MTPCNYTQPQEEGSGDPTSQPAGDLTTTPIKTNIPYSTQGHLSCRVPFDNSPPLSVIIPPITNPALNQHLLLYGSILLSTGTCSYTGTFCSQLAPTPIQEHPALNQHLLLYRSILLSTGPCSYTGASCSQLAPAPIQEHY